jgi:hypothetical protein
MRTIRTREQAVSLLLRNVTLNGECWEWNRAWAKHWYPTIWFEGANHSPHRLSYEAFVGEIPDGQFICHRCDNPPCINPLHLFAGTPLDNIRDMDSKGRRRIGVSRGSQNGFSILNEGIVMEMRRLRGSGMTYKKIGAVFGVRLDTTYYAVKIGWRHI